MGRGRKGYLEGIVTIQTMKMHVKDGMTDDEIAELYGVDSAIVYRYRKKYGIMKHREKVVRDVKMYYRMKECGLTDEQVAFIWNMSRRALSEWKKREEIDGVALQDGEVIFRKERLS